METQLIISEVYENAVDRLTKAELLSETMQNLLIKYEEFLSYSIVNRCKCNAISKTLDNNSNKNNDEKYLLEKLKISKKMYNKTLKLK